MHKLLILALALTAFAIPAQAIQTAPNATKPVEASKPGDSNKLVCRAVRRTVYCPRPLGG